MHLALADLALNIQKIEWLEKIFSRLGIHPTKQAFTTDDVGFMFVHQAERKGIALRWRTGTWPHAESVLGLESQIILRLVDTEDASDEQSIIRLIFSPANKNWCIYVQLDEVRRHITPDSPDVATLEALSKKVTLSDNDVESILEIISRIFLAAESLMPAMGAI